MTVYSFDGEACKHFKSVYLYFSVESMNMCLGLSTDGFNPFRSFAALYFYWLVVLMVYNLPSKIYIRLEFMFLSTIIPNPNSPG